MEKISIILFLTVASLLISCEKESDNLYSLHSDVIVIGKYDDEADCDDDFDVEVIADAEVNCDDDFDVEVITDDEEMSDTDQEYTINWGTEKNDMVTGAFLTKQNQLYITGYSYEGTISDTSSWEAFILRVDMNTNIQEDKILIGGDENLKNVIAFPLFDTYAKNLYVGAQLHSEGESRAVLMSLDNTGNSRWEVVLNDPELMRQSSFEPQYFVGDDLIVSGRDKDYPFIAQYTKFGEEIWKRVLPYYGTLFGCDHTQDLIYCSGAVNSSDFLGDGLPVGTRILLDPFFVTFDLSGKMINSTLVEQKGDVARTDVAVDGASSLFSYSSLSKGCYLAVLDQTGAKRYEAIPVSSNNNCYIFQGIVFDPFGNRTLLRQEYVSPSRYDLFLSWHDSNGQKIKEQHIKGNRDEASFFLFYYDNGETKKRYIVGSSNSDEFSYNGSNGDYDIFIIVTDLMR